MGMIEIVSSKRHPFRPGYLFVQIFQEHWFIYKRNFFKHCQINFLLFEFSSQLSEPFVGSVDLFCWLKFAS